MGHLEKLTVSRRVIPAAQPRHGQDLTAYRRRKLVANIEEQIELANLAIAGKTPELRRKRGRKIVKVRPRLWWKTDPGGHVFTQIRYNKVPINIAGRGTTIEVGPLTRLPMVLRTVIKAIKAGELDNSIENAAKKSAR